MISWAEICYSNAASLKRMKLSNIIWLRSALPQLSSRWYAVLVCPPYAPNTQPQIS